MIAKGVLKDWVRNLIDFLKDWARNSIDFQSNPTGLNEEFQLILKVLGRIWIDF